MPRPRWRLAAMVVALCAITAGALAWDLAEDPPASSSDALRPVPAAAQRSLEVARVESGAAQELLPVAGQDTFDEAGEVTTDPPSGDATQPSVREDSTVAAPAPAEAPRIASDAGAPPPPPEPDSAEPAAPVACGLITCGSGDVCCNPSCGTCVPEGETCDLTPCEARVQYPVSTMCGQNTCSTGEVCCNPTCGTCAPEGVECDTTPCTPRITVPVSVRCGQNTCSVGEVCCNPSCGTCAAEGATCDDTPCTPRIRYL